MISNRVMALLKLAFHAKTNVHEAENAFRMAKKQAGSEIMDLIEGHAGSNPEDSWAYTKFTLTTTNLVLNQAMGVITFYVNFKNNQANKKIMVLEVSDRKIISSNRANVIITVRFDSSQISMNTIDDILPSLINSAERDIRGF